MTKSISATELKALIDGTEEFSLIDVREQRVFGARHILLCANIPLSQLEMQAPDAIPRKTSCIVFCDDGEGLADRAAGRLAAFGYTNLSVLDGGIAAWEAAGLEIFSGLNVPSKAFGEFVEHTYGTPSVSAEELNAMLKSGENLVVLDSRPMDEYRVMNIPGGIDVPGAELVHRSQEVAPDEATTVVVNCAGRTRSIIGAQSLINAGVPNKVVALRNGTMGWHLAGLKLEHGQARRSPEVSKSAMKQLLQEPRTPQNGSVLSASMRPPSMYGALSKETGRSRSWTSVQSRNSRMATLLILVTRRAGSWCRRRMPMLRPRTLG